MSCSRSPCTTASPKLPPTSPLRQERCGRRIESRPAVVRSANFRHRAPQIAPRLRDPVSATGPLIGQFRQSTRSRDRDQQSQSRRSCQIQTPRIGKDAATVGGTWVEGPSVWGISAPLYPWRGWGVGAVISALISAWACWMVSARVPAAWHTWKSRAGTRGFGDKRVKCLKSAMLICRYCSVVWVAVVAISGPPPWQRLSP